MPVPGWLNAVWRFVQPRGPAGSRHGRPPIVRDDELSWLFPPATVADPLAWDTYWQNQVAHGVEGFVYLFVRGTAPKLVEILEANQLTRVLFVGGGLSQEPRAFARIGLTVTALDLSPWATATARDQVVPDDFLAGIVGGRSAVAGGRVEFVAGDLTDPTCCPGPFDAVIDRKTLQLFAGPDLSAAMTHVADRLAPRGLFFSQSHDGCWKPPAEPRNPTEDWFTKHGWTRYQPTEPISGRVAMSFTTTG